MKHQEDLKNAHALVELLIADDLITSASVEWSAENGVMVIAAIGRMETRYRVAKEAREYARGLEGVAWTLTQLLRKAWEQKAKQDALDRGDRR